MPSNQKQLEIKSDGVIVGIKDLSVGVLELDVSEIKNIKITLAILIVFSLAVLTYYVLWRVIEYLEEKEKENPESLINDNK